MNTDHQVAVSKQNQVLSQFPSELEWKMMRELGTAAFRSGLLPTAIKNAEAATIIALKSRELGIPPMVGYAHIFIVNGKPSMSAELIQATARKFLPTLQIKILQSTNDLAEIEFNRGDRGSIAIKFSFTIEDARRAGLLGKDVWKQYPRDMLFSRCMTTGLRKVCPDALMGIGYTPEELGASVDQEGNVIETTGRRVEAHHEEPPAPPQPVNPISSTSPKEEPKSNWRISEPETQRVQILCQGLRWGQKALSSVLEKNYGKTDLSDLLESEYKDFIIALELKVKEQVEASEKIQPITVSPEFEKAYSEIDDPRMVK